VFTIRCVFSEHAILGNICFLLDGLDEVKSDRTKLVDQLHEFLAQFPAAGLTSQVAQITKKSSRR